MAKRSDPKDEPAVEALPDPARRIEDARLVEAARERTMLEISEVYERITGRKCETSIFVVRKDSAVGCYMVHPHDTAEFYEFNIKRMC